MQRLKQGWRRGRRVLAPLLLCAALPGCGSEGSTSGTAPTPTPTLQLCAFVGRQQDGSLFSASCESPASPTPTPTPITGEALNCRGKFPVDHSDCDDEACLRAAADEWFCRLKTISFGGTKVHWVSGHAFDTILDYLLTSDRGVATAREFAQIVVDRWRAAIAIPGEACWYDDFGWWAIAAQRAAAHPELWRDAAGNDVQIDLKRYNQDGNQIGLDDPPRGSALVELEKIRDSSWVGMDPPAPSVWEACSQQDFCRSEFSSLEPLYSGGVWNNRWSKVAWHGKDMDSPEYGQLSCHKQKGCDPTTPPEPERGADGAYNDTDQDYFPLCGIQNSVTNGLHLIAAERFYAQFSEERYRAAAEAQLTFFENWLDFPGTITDPTDPHVGSTLGLLFTYASDRDPAVGLVRERTSVYADFGSNPKHRDRYWRPHLAWAGDQGLFLGGLVASMARLDRADPRYQRLLSVAKGILQGVRDYLVTEDFNPATGQTEPGWLLPWRDDPINGHRSCAADTTGSLRCAALASDNNWALPPTYGNAGRPPGDDPFDHDTGIAAFLRYLLYAYDTNIDLRAFLQQETDYPAFLRSYGFRIAQYRDPSPVQDPSQARALSCLQCANDLMHDSNRLAILVAAIRMHAAQ